jgi:hypothetical protein
MVAVAVTLVRMVGVVAVVVVVEMVYLVLVGVVMLEMNKSSQIILLGSIRNYFYPLHSFTKASL